MILDKISLNKTIPASKKISVNIWIIFFFLLISFLYYYCSLALVNTDTLGAFIYRARDNGVYIETTWQILDSLKDSNLSNDFSGVSFGYGYRYFIILSIFRFSFYLAKNDTKFCFSLVISNL